jgi:hypothetical protein
VKEVKFGAESYISEHTEYNREQLEDLFHNLKQTMGEAESQGLKDVFVQFSSTMEPYEDHLGPVEIQVRGYRELNWIERKEGQEREVIEELAKTLGCTPYEAGIYKRLKDKGVV